MRDLEEHLLEGRRVLVLPDLGHAAVQHDGSITWDELQRIKTALWGAEAVAIEVYPPESMLVNAFEFRHLWRLGAGEFWPDMLGRYTADGGCISDHLQTRWIETWSEAESVFKGT